jgi:hypothetical protein
MVNNKLGQLYVKIWLSSLKSAAQEKKGIRKDKFTLFHQSFLSITSTFLTKL